MGRTGEIFPLLFGATAVHLKRAFLQLERICAVSERAAAKALLSLPFCPVHLKPRLENSKCRGSAGEITSLEVASIAFVWSAATPLSRLPHDFRAEARTHFIYNLEETNMKKDIKFSTRMTSEDREAIKELAKQSGMSMSDYVTACCLGKQVVVIDGLKEVLKELKSIGRNLNQLVTLAHMGRVTVINLESMRQAFSELCAAVRMILERKRW